MAAQNIITSNYINPNKISDKVRGGKSWREDHDLVQMEINKIDDKIKVFINDDLLSNEVKYWKVINMVASLSPQIADALLKRRNDQMA